MNWERTNEFTLYMLLGCIAREETRKRGCGLTNNLFRVSSPVVSPIDIISNRLALKSYKDNTVSVPSKLQTSKLQTARWQHSSFWSLCVTKNGKTFRIRLKKSCDAGSSEAEFLGYGER